jgi:hypothetical protein
MAASPGLTRSLAEQEAAGAIGRGIAGKTAGHGPLARNLHQFIQHDRVRIRESNG